MIMTRAIGIDEERDMKKVITCGCCGAADAICGIQGYMYENQNKNRGPVKDFEYYFSKSVIVTYGDNNIGKSYAMQVVYLSLKHLVAYAKKCQISKQFLLFLQRCGKWASAGNSGGC